MKPRVLVACVGNLFLGDDAFGVEVAKELSLVRVPEWLEVVDFGIRGFDLAFSLLDGRYDAAILVDLVKRGHAPGTLSIIEPVLDDDDVALETHGMEPVSVLRLVRTLGGTPPALRIVGCEPARVSSADEDMSFGLSAPVAAAVEPAAALVLEVAEALRAEAAKHA